MKNNPIIEAMLNRKSIRKYKAQMPTEETIETVVRAGQQKIYPGARVLPTEATR